MAEPELAVVFSPREWADRLVRYVTDHGGGRVRLRVVEGRVALEERFDVLVAEDVTSFLSPRFVRELHDGGRAVLGVFDPAEPTGRDRLAETGVDDVVECTATSEEFVRRIGLLVSLHRTAAAATEDAVALGTAPGTGAPAGRRIVAVGGPPGGCGATEVAIELARAGRALGSTVVLVDADDRAPAVAQRLGLPLSPNLRTAVEVVFSGDGVLAETLTPFLPGGFDVLPGLGRPDDWAQLRPVEAADVVGELADACDQVVANVGPHLEDVAAVGGPDRFGLTRAMLRAAASVVAVAAPTPVGVTRLLEWVAALHELGPRSPAHVVVNRAPEAGFARAEVEGEIRRTYAPASLHFVPDDGRVGTAAWRGEPVRPGPFTRAVGAVARAVLADGAVPARRAPRALWRIHAT